MENDGIMFTTELEIRPTALLPLVADLGRLNMNYPALKVFVDVVVNGACLTDDLRFTGYHGLTDEQLHLFMRTTIEPRSNCTVSANRWAFSIADEAIPPGSAMH